jgi:hypothetical protein
MAHPKSGYRNSAGKRVRGVTTIIGRFKDSGGLMYWAFEQGKAAERGEIDKLYDKRDEAAESGTLAHSMVEYHINGKEFEVPDLPALTVKEATSAFKSYLNWASMTKLKIVEQEMPLVSEKYQFGGCPDAIGEIDGELCLVDWKTSNSVYQDYLIQLAAYKQLWEENNPDRLLTGGFHLCRFAKSHGDFAHHYYPDLSRAWEQFKLFLRAYEIDKELKKRAA